jgi:hypothetical protein
VLGLSIRPALREFAGVGCDAIILGLLESAEEERTIEAAIVLTFVLAIGVVVLIEVGDTGVRLRAPSRH